MVIQEDHFKKQGGKRDNPKCKNLLAGKRMDGWKGVIDAVKAALGLGG